MFEARLIYAPDSSHKFVEQYGFILEDDSRIYTLTPYQNPLYPEPFDWQRANYGVDEWIVCDLMTGKPLWIFMNIRFSNYTDYIWDARSLQNLINLWESPQHKAVRYPDWEPQMPLAVWLKDQFDESYAEAYFERKGRRHTDFIITPRFVFNETEIPYRTYQGFVIADAYVNIINDRAFAELKDVEYPEGTTLVDLGTGDILRTDNTNEEVWTFGYLEAVRLSWEEPIEEGVLPPYVSDEYLACLRSMDVDYWDMALRGNLRRK